MQQQFLRRKEAAVYLREKYGVGSAGSLAKYASLGTGPMMVYVAGFPTYTVDALDAWARSKMSAPIRKASEKERAA